MTFENSKRLYTHFVALGMDEAAAGLLLKHPDLEAKKEVKKAKKEE